VYEEIYGETFGQDNCVALLLEYVVEYLVGHMGWIELDIKRDIASCCTIFRFQIWISQRNGMYTYFSSSVPILILLRFSYLKKVGNYET
jgi:hypothetical protein